MNTPSCGAPHHLYPDTLCTEPAGHYRRDRDPHAGPLIVDGRERGGAAWDEPKERRMNDRHTADTITDDALDQLYAQLAEASEQLRLVNALRQQHHDAATAAVERATRAEADLKTLGQTALGYQQRAWDAEAELKQAQAALDRVRALADRIDTGAPWTANHTDLAARIRDAITGPKPDACCGKPPGAVCIHDVATPAATEATGHVYLSTGCLHGHHDYCQSHTGLSGQKTPATCKFCGAPCTCHCHQPAHNAGPTVTECAEADRRWWATEKAGE